MKNKKWLVAGLVGVVGIISYLMIDSYRKSSLRKKEILRKKKQEQLIKDSEESLRDLNESYKESLKKEEFNEQERKEKE
jgi:hypothetical protein